MIPDTHREETISRAFVLAIAAKASLKVELSSGVEYGIDGHFRLVRPITTNRMKKPTAKQKLSGVAIPEEPEVIIKEFGIGLDFQLKASVKCEITDSHVKYDAKPDAYDKLVDRDRTNPVLLILCALEREVEKWVTVNDAHTLLGGRCFYHFVEGPMTTNTDSVRITIPRDQLLDERSLLNLMEDFQRTYNPKWGLSKKDVS